MKIREVSKATRREAERFGVSLTSITGRKRSEAVLKKRISVKKKGDPLQKCTICCDYEKLILLDCCSTFVGEGCIRKWLAENGGCPFCRSPLSKETIPTQMIVNMGYKIDTIVSTLQHNNIKRIGIHSEEFDSLREYFTEWEHVPSKSKIGQKCSCSSPLGGGGFYGHLFRISLDIENKRYTESYLCTHCADPKPDSLWEKMTHFFPVSPDFFLYNPSFLRDKLIRCGYDPPRDTEDLWMNIERMLRDHCLKKFISYTEYVYIYNLLDICLGRLITNGVEGGRQSRNFCLFNKMVRYIDFPSQVPGHYAHTGFFTKCFFKPAWEIVREGKCFMDLYALASLWNITRDPERTFEASFGTWENSTKYFKEWKKGLIS